MSNSRGGRSGSPPSSTSPPPRRGRPSRSLSRSRRSRSRSHETGDVLNPGNNLYVTGLSARVTPRDLEDYFNKKGKVMECQLVTDPHTKESRGFGFITMETNEDAERCIKYLHRSVLEGRLITVEKAKRKRGRTPTPGKYQGIGSGKQGDGPRRNYSPRRQNDRNPNTYNRSDLDRPTGRYVPYDRTSGRYNDSYDRTSGRYDGSNDRTSGRYGGSYDRTSGRYGGPYDRYNSGSSSRGRGRGRGRSGYS